MIEVLEALAFEELHDLGSVHGILEILSDKIGIVQPSPAMWLCFAHNMYIRTFVWFSCTGTLQLYRGASAKGWRGGGASQAEKGHLADGIFCGATAVLRE
jgi:hypothetical protein